jgi:hypothetical protein
VLEVLLLLNSIIFHDAETKLSARCDILSLDEDFSFIDEVFLEFDGQFDSFLNLIDFVSSKGIKCDPKIENPLGLRVCLVCRARRDHIIVLLGDSIKINKK